MTSLISKLESLLFVSNKPLELKALSKFSGASIEEVTKAMEELAAAREDSGIVILSANNTYQFATNSENTETVTAFLNNDLREKLTDATVEVLAIIAYRQPISRAEIEAIRGVNSQYSIRHLLMRGMIEKVPNPNDTRGSLYQVTTEFLQHLGIHKVEDLPSFEDLVSNIKLPDTPEVKTIENDEATQTMDTQTQPETETPTKPHPEELITAPEHKEELIAAPETLEIEPPQDHNLKPPLPPKISSNNTAQ